MALRREEGEFYPLMGVVWCGAAMCLP